MNFVLFLVFVLFICFFILLGGFFSFLITKKTGIIDVFWALGITTAALSIIRLFGDSSYQSYLVMGMIFVWGVRLSSFLIFRVLDQKNDHRYERMIKRSAAVSMIKNSFIQWPLQVLVVITIYPLTFSDSIQNEFLIIGTILFIIGLIGEVISDLQLSTFKKSATGICTIGLWKYSRHPNYFFECLLWFGISVVFFGSPVFFVSLIGPLSLFVIMYFVTGPYTEKCSIERHGDMFLDYQSNTSYFFPWKQK